MMKRENLIPVLPTTLISGGQIRVLQHKWFDSQHCYLINIDSWFVQYPKMGNENCRVT